MDGAQQVQAESTGVESLYRTRSVVYVGSGMLHDMGSPVLTRSRGATLDYRSLESGACVVVFQEWIWTERDLEP